MIDLFKEMEVTLPEFIELLRAPKLISTTRAHPYTGEPETRQVDSVFEYIDKNKEKHWHDLMLWAFSEPHELVQLAQVHAKCYPDTAPERQKVAMLVQNMAESIDGFTRIVGRAGLWKRFYKKGTVDVVEVWRTKDDAIVGEPTERKILSDNIRSKLVSMAVMERQAGVRTVMLSLSDAIYREDARCDHMLDVGDLFTASGSEAMGVFQKSFQMLETMWALAEELHSSGKVELTFKRKKFYDLLETFIRRELKPEDNPDALIEIGGWA